MTTNLKTEVRIALALNGGVSLAVWMSGVVKELDLICRASQGQPAPQDATPEETLHYETWQRITEAKHITLTVDVVAGTSAGGLNGTLLAAALAYGAPLPDLKALWNQSAAIAPKELLWPRGETSVPSVLNGTFFADTVTEVLHGIAEGGARESTAPISLFVTATTLGRADTTYADAEGAEFQVADHRRLYRFRSAPRYRYHPHSDDFTKEEENDFRDGLSELGRAARASAGYPVAFAPIQETDALAKRIYPKSSNPPSTAHRPYLVDGGILDNAPIEPILNEIATRPADGNIRRKLVYVVPSSGVVPRLPADEDQRAPTWLQVVSSAMGFPREADFRDDINCVRSYLEDARDRQAAASEIFSRALLYDDERKQLVDAASSLLSQYRSARIIGTLRPIRAKILARLGRPAVLASDDDTETSLIPASAALWAPAAENSALPSGDPWTCGFSGALRTVQVLIRNCRNRIADGNNQFIALADKLSEIREKIRALHEVVLDQVYEADVSTISNDAAELPALALTNVIDTTFVRFAVQEQLATLVHRASDLYAKQLTVDSATTIQALIAAEIVTGALASRSEEQTPPPFDFVRLGPGIKSVVIPQAADMKLGGWKLYGTRLGHFGAFGRAEWRDWDWTWGRLDATTRLARMLEVPTEQINTLERQVIDAEGRNVAQMTAQLTELQNAQIIQQLRQSREGQTALRGILTSGLRFLTQTDPPPEQSRIPKIVPTAARYLRVALEQTAPSQLHGTEYLIRLVAWYHRRKLWRWIESGPADQKISTRPST